MKRIAYFYLFLFPFLAYSQGIQLRDSLDGSAVSFATISFGDGLGTFADEDGHKETKGRYP